MTEQTLLSMAGAGQTLAPQQQHGPKLLPVLERVIGYSAWVVVVHVRSRSLVE